MVIVGPGHSHRTLPAYVSRGSVFNVTHILYGGGARRPRRKVGNGRQMANGVLDVHLTSKWPTASVGFDCNLMLASLEKVIFTDCRLDRANQLEVSSK